MEGLQATLAGFNDDDHRILTAPSTLQRPQAASSIAGANGIRRIATLWTPGRVVYKANSGMLELAGVRAGNGGQSDARR